MTEGDRKTKSRPPEVRVAQATGLSFYEKRRVEVRERLVDERDEMRQIDWIHKPKHLQKRFQCNIVAVL